ncbi:hypothetical protein H8D76_02955 [Candidatus Bathyarchaeota archaeon]|nr:hypothetical protein [Candidatus Bathyarchaeota archaeon]
MVFNIVKILEIESGAELDHTVYDQWVRIVYKGYSLSIFDMDMLVSEDAVGDFHEVKIGAMFTELESDPDGPLMAKGNRFRGRVVEVTENDGLFEHIVDLDGLRVILSDHEEHNVGSVLKFKARLDLLDFRGATGGWKDV